MDISVELYTWLLSTSVITEYDVKEQLSDKITLEQDATQLFEIGLKIPILLKRLQRLIV